MTVLDLNLAMKPVNSWPSAEKEKKTTPNAHEVCWFGDRRIEGRDIHLTSISTIIMLRTRLNPEL